MDDGTIVVDAITVDGRRVDPFSIHFPDYSLRPPNYDLLHAKSFAYNQIWSDYFNRMHMPANTSYRKPMKQFMFALPERTGRSERRHREGRRLLGARHEPALRPHRLLRLRSARAVHPSRTQTPTCSAATAS